jgi:ubiquitin-protein ligase
MVKHRVALDPKERKRVQKDLRRVLAESSANLGANPFFASSPRARRLAKDFAEMEELVRESSILEIKKTEGDPPDRYVIVFKGGGLSPEGKVKENHEVRLDLGVNYPTALPSIHWLTPIKHPNISGGNPCLGNIGMNPRIRLVDIVEVLWDMNRLAIYSPSAEQWKEYAKYRLPVDERILRDKAPRPPAEEGGEDLIILGRW